MNQHLHAGPAVNLLQEEGQWEESELESFSLSLFKNDTLLRPLSGDPGDCSALNQNLLHWMA